MYANPERIRQWRAEPEQFRSYSDPANIRRIQAEQRIARRVLRRILKAGYTVRVHDGEEFHPMTSNEADAWAVMGETDEDRIFVYTPDGKRLGSILLIWGNDEDLVSDWSWNTAVDGSETIMNKLAD